ncbi:MAG: DMT family protein [Myxococcota bacterium]
MLRALTWTSPVVGTTLLLTASNVFMTFAWYAHLRDLRQRPWLVAALVSWGIALFEYLLQVPANRIGADVLRLDQLKILQEIITLTVFVPFALFYMKRTLSLDFLWAGVCLCGAAYFLFRNGA